MSEVILFYVFGYREAHLADLLIQDWQQQGHDVTGYAYCYRDAAARRLLQAPGRWERVVSDSEILKKHTRVPSNRCLDQLEDRYGVPNLWRHAIWDRHLSTTSRGGNLYKYGSAHDRNDTLRIIAARILAVQDLVEQGHPRSTVFVSIDIGSGSALAVHQVAKYFGSAITVPVPNRLGTGTLFFDDIRQPPESLIDDYYQRRRGKVDESTNKATIFIDAFRAGQVGMRVKKAATSPPQDGTKLERLRSSPKRAPLAARDRLVRISRRRYASRKYSEKPLESDQDFVLMPLHLEPELALLAFAPEHYDQVATIRQVAQATPASTVLAVREHPVVQGQRPISHYREISNIPNTVWNSPALPSRAEILRSRAVVSVTGSAVMEAAILGVPSLILGRIWFDACESIHQSLTPADLPQLLSVPERLAPDAADIHAFVASIMDQSTRWAVSSISKQLCDVQLQQAKEDERFRAYRDLIRDRLQLGFH